MTTSFKGWGSSWSDSWGLIASNPNEVIGKAGFKLNAVASVTAIGWISGSAAVTVGATGNVTGPAVPTGFISGTASLTFSAIGIVTDPNAYDEPIFYGMGYSKLDKNDKPQELTVEEVQGHWELLELRLKAGQAKQVSPNPEAKRVSKTVNIAQPNVQDAIDERQRQEHESLVALLLELA